MSKPVLSLIALGSTILLTACGDGWETQKTNTSFPYGNERTAGSGVVYVRAKMLPEKELVIEPVIQEDASSVEEAPFEPIAEPVLEAEEIFSEAQRKAKSPAPKTADEHAAVESGHDNGQTEEQHAGLIEPQAGTPASVEITADEYVAQAPQRVVARKVEIIKNSAQTQAARSRVESMMSDVGFEEEETVEVFENEVIQPEKEIVVPKKDPSGFLSIGQETLDEIYNDVF